MTLKQLLTAAGDADGMTRIEYRDPIAAFGEPAIEAVAPWLLIDRLGRFAVRVIEVAAAQPGCAEPAAATLRRALGRAPDGVRGDIARALTVLSPTPRSRSPRALNGSPDQALAQLREVVARWRRRGKQPQPGIPWPRERWLRDLPGHRSVLNRLPGRLDRSTIAAIARDAATSDDAAIESLVAVMAWGHGRTGYAQSRAGKILAEPRVGRRLRLVAEMVDERGALAGYERLASDSRVEGLGPSFGTKFLYFVQDPTARPRALIHDRVMGDWLIEVAGLPLKPEPYSLDRYGAYLRQMHAWADELECAPDEVEMSIFRAIQPPGSQWGE